MIKTKLNELCGRLKRKRNTFSVPYCVRVARSVFAYFAHTAAHRRRCKTGITIAGHHVDLRLPQNKMTSQLSGVYAGRSSSLAGAEEEAEEELRTAETENHSWNWQNENGK